MQTCIIEKLKDGEKTIICHANGEPADITDIDTYASVEFPEMLEGLFIKTENNGKLQCLSLLAKKIKFIEKEISIHGEFDNETNKLLTFINLTNLIKNNYFYTGATIQ